MIRVSEEVKKMIQVNMLNSFISADTETIENKHTGKYISNLNFDVDQITRMLAEAFLSIFKDGLTLFGLLLGNVLSKLEVIFNCNHYDPFSNNYCKETW